MNKKQLIAAITIFIALLIIAMLILKKEDSNWKKGKFADKTPLIKDFNVNKVAKFAITDGKKTLKLAIKNNEWVVLNRNSYPADFAKIRNFIMRIGDLKIAQNLRMKKSAYGSVKLLPPKQGEKNDETGTLLSFYDKTDKLLLSILLGVTHLEKKEKQQAFVKPKEDGRYVMLSGTNKPVLTIDPLSDASTDPTLWLNKNFIKIPSLKSMTVLDKSGKKMWKIIHKTPKGAYALEGLKKNQKVLPRKMYEATSAFANLKFLDILPQDTDEKITGLNNPITVIIDTFSEVTYKINLAVKKQKVFAKIAISANLSKKRASGKNENNKEKEALDKAFAENQKTVKGILTAGKHYTEWIYELPMTEMQKVLIKHEEMVR